VGDWKEGIFTNLGDSCLLLELFVEVFVGLHVRQSMFFKSIPSPVKRKAEREGTHRYIPRTALILAWPGQRRRYGVV